ncbi:hypothetical protein DLAC_06391 [Tieghemostelium lacteum]|uniref:DNA mismatch repair proteins mutS family domain-containing protein n=1 Tax=Tieghemostelium lacteum TaxID=361077 RepID=A0A151ZEM8_TIELA|nr:hypothetical protein DLAC_06391 [Tieghemostelium lacteum]|eukprot:KYQ92412.1 hypothetical protein DLAC_06391 [Tieghemostelium lacteum]
MIRIYRRSFLSLTRIDQYCGKRFISNKSNNLDVNLSKSVESKKKKPKLNTLDRISIDYTSNDKRKELVDNVKYSKKQSIIDNSVELDKQKEIEESIIEQVGAIEKRKDKNVSEATGIDTPAMLQYNEAKSKYPGSVMLFRVGDFYEIFGSDAIEVSKLLNIVLTQRGIKSRGKDSASSIPMCGFPSQSLDNYIEKLIKLGKTVAVCDQVEDSQIAKKNKSKVVKREVVRLVTPGTLVEERFLKSSQNNFLCTFSPVFEGKQRKTDNVLENFKSTQKFILSWLDMSTGHFFISTSTYENLAGDLNRISPSEVLLPQCLCSMLELKKILKPYHITTVGESMDDLYGYSQSVQLFKDTFTVERDWEEIQDLFDQSEISVAGAILRYTIDTQLGRIPHLYAPTRFSVSQSMFIDLTTMNSLEVIKTYQGLRKGSLLDSLDRTLTSSGSRLIHSRIQSPSLNLNEIERRLNLVERFYLDESLTKDIRKLLSKTMDIERCLQRIYIGRAGPRDLSAIGSTLAISTHIKEVLLERSKNKTIVQLLQGIEVFDSLLNELSSALVDNPPFLTSQGGFIEVGYDDQLDQQRKLRDNSKELISQMESKYKSIVAPQLKIKHNQIIGWHFEIASSHRDKIPSHFIHVQTLLSHMRFKSSDLIALEEKINIAASEVLQRELNIFDNLCNSVLEMGDNIKKCSNVLAEIDVSTSLALIGRERLYVKPKVVQEPILKIKSGRHPTVEQFSDNKSFVSNDLLLNPTDMWLITGANMGGKSTFLRQNALICLMAQMGSFVPAESANVGLVDSIFSRVGSSDDLSGDKSTFMIEMVETASILRKATDKSLVIMDEVGRGTSTIDGLSIAQSVIEHLTAVNRSRCLFATHYHELAKKIVHPSVKPYQLLVKEDDSHLLFTHKIIPGITNKSYGIYCAKLAGLPESVIKRSIEILNKMEQ